MRFSTLLSLVAIALAAYSLWSVKRAERALAAAPAAVRVGGSLDALLSEARRHCERALKLIGKGKAKEAAREIERALGNLSEVERRGGAEKAKEKVGDLIERAEEALRALRERLEEGRK